MILSPKVCGTFSVWFSKMSTEPALEKTSLLYSTPLYGRTLADIGIDRAKFTVPLHSQVGIVCRKRRSSPEAPQSVGGPRQGLLRFYKRSAFAHWWKKTGKSHSTCSGPFSSRTMWSMRRALALKSPGASFLTSEKSESWMIAPNTSVSKEVPRF